MMKINNNNGLVAIPKDDQWDSYSVSLHLPYGEEVYLKDTKPEITWDCGGLAQVDGVLHIFEEDDQHYWTVATLDQYELSELIRMVTELHYYIEKYDHGRNTAPSFFFKNGKIPKIKSDRFRFHFDFIGKKIEKIILTFPNNYEMWLYPWNVEDMKKVLSRIDLE